MGLDSPFPVAVGTNFVNDEYFIGVQRTFKVKISHIFSYSEPIVHGVSFVKGFLEGGGVQEDCVVQWTGVNVNLEDETKNWKDR